MPPNGENSLKRWPAIIGITKFFTQDSILYISYFRLRVRKCIANERYQTQEYDFLYKRKSSAITVRGSLYFWLPRQLSVCK